jgi:hypothetical protein
MAVLRLDNNTVAQTSWKSCSQQAWDQRFSIQLDRVNDSNIKSRFLNIYVYFTTFNLKFTLKFKLKFNEKTKLN